jgi:hypothetical protein
MHFFAASTYLEQHIADEKSDSKIANLRYYANNKTRIPLKGNMFKAAFPLQTEGQQLIGSKVLSLAKDREIRNVDFFQFVQLLKTDEELLKSAEACRQLLKFNTDLSSIDGQFLCVAQFTVYLIDLVQDLRPSSKWEELRLFLVSLIKAHNAASADKSAFLYQRGDLKTGNYLDTYNSLPGDRPRKMPFIRATQKDRRNQRLQARANTGFPRQLSSDGVTRKLGQQEVQLRYADSPGDIRMQVASLFA